MRTIAAVAQSLSHLKCEFSSTTKNKKHDRKQWDSEGQMEVLGVSGPVGKGLMAQHKKDGYVRFSGENG